jgi:hypothetical protein
MGGQVSSLLFSATCEGMCLHDDTVSLKQRMARYGVNSVMMRTPQDVIALRVQLYVSGAQQPTTNFLLAMANDNMTSAKETATLRLPSDPRARTVPWLAHQLHERFHPDAMLVLPHELNLLFLHGQCPYGAKTDVLCSVISSFVTACLGRLGPEEPLYEARTRVYQFSESDTPTDCQCAHWEAHNYLVHRSQQGNEHVKGWVTHMTAHFGFQGGRCTEDACLSTLPDMARWGYILRNTQYVPLQADWWKTLRPLQAKPAVKKEGAKPNFKGMAKPEDVTPSCLLDIVAMTEPGATVDLSDFASLQTSHVERLCLEWMACGRVPRKLLLSGTLVDGGLILSRGFLKFLCHPQVYKVDVSETSFLECADPPLLQRLVLNGDLDRLLFYPCDDKLPAWVALGASAQARVVSMLPSLTMS